MRQRVRTRWSAHLDPGARRGARDRAAQMVVIPHFVPDPRPLVRPRRKAPRERVLGMVGDLPAEPIDTDLGRQRPGALHLGVVVVPLEQDVAPVHERHVTAEGALLVDHGAQVVHHVVEPAALPVGGIDVLRGAIHREGHFVDARPRQSSRRFLVEGAAIGGGVQVDVRVLALHQLAHLDGPLVQERLAVVEEVDAFQGRADFGQHALEELDVEHAGLPRLGDPGLGSAARIEAGHVACGGALDIHPRRQWRHRERSLRRGLVGLERQLERAVAAEARPAAVQILAQLRGCGAGPDVADGADAGVTEDALAVGVGAAADDAAVAQQDGRVPRPGTGEVGGEIAFRHGGRLTIHA